MVCHKTVGSTLIGDSNFARLLLGEIVAESYAIVESAEEDIHMQAGLVTEAHLELVVVVPDDALFAPNGLPLLREGRGGCTQEAEATGEVETIGQETHGRPVDKSIGIAQDGIRGGAIVG